MFETPTEPFLKESFHMSETPTEPFLSLLRALAGII